MRGRLPALIIGALVLIPATAWGIAGTQAGSNTSTAAPAVAAATTSTPDVAAAPSATPTAAPAAADVADLTTTAPLAGSVFRGIETLTPTGSVPDGQTVHVGVTLAGRDPAGAAAALRAIDDPSSDRYQQYFSPEEWDAAYGPDPAAVSGLTSWLQDAGLEVLQADGTYVYASGTAAQVQSRFGITLKTFNVDGHDFFANVDEARVPAGLGITSVLGLSNYKQAHTPHHVTSQDPNAFPVSADTTPQDLWSIYDMPDVNKGDNQGLSVFGWTMDEAAIASDLRQFEVLNQLPAVPFSVKHFGKQKGSTGVPSTDQSAIVEWDLDTQASSGMSPYASSITAYEGYSPTDVDLLAPIASWIKDKHGSRQGSASYGECEEDPVFSAAGMPLSAATGTEAAWNPVLQKGAATGRTLFVSAGDNGYGCDPSGNGLNGVTLGPVPYQSWPAVSPYVVAVGGTVITTDGATPPKRDVEYAWTHGGGGASPFVEQPEYQSSAGVPLPTRGVPDVAAQSGDLLSGYQIVTGGSQTGVGGTSLSAPLMQGMWARVNAASAKGAGFANHSFYKHPEVFFDVTLGTNGLYQAGPGWDYTTGLGVPDVTKLIKAVDGKLAPVHPSSNTTPLPAFAQPACAAGEPPLTDPEGDATGLVLASTPRSSEPDLDITSADARINGTNLVATMHVKGLSATPPAGSTGDAFDVGLGYAGQAYWVEASRVLSTPSADFGSGSDSRGTSYGETDITAAFDTTASTVTVTVPLATFNKHLPANAAPLGTGSVLSGFSAITWQTEVAVNGGVDTAAGQCSITL